MEKYIKNELFLKYLEAAAILVIGYIIIRIIAYSVRRLFFKNLSKQSQMILSKSIVYIGTTIIVFIAIKRLDIINSFAALFGAAGVLGIILGIASQNSIVNIVSGFFLISEQSFQIGDLIKVGDKQGNVYSIDLLSIKLRTLDNLMIRIPNQTIISTEVTNITRFPIRRMDIMVSVAYKEDLKKVIGLLKKIANDNPLCLDEPEPIILLKKFAESSIDILFGVWFEKKNYVEVRNSLIIEIKETFEKESVEIPFPHMSVYAGENTRPIPVSIKQPGKNIEK